MSKPLQFENILSSIDKDVFDGTAIDLGSFDIHDDLSREVWDENDKLFPDIRTALLRIANDFIETIEFDEIIDDSVNPRDLVTDVQFVGSLASFNYSKYSDIDLHIIVDLSELELDEPTANLFKKYFMKCKNEWNNNHTDLTVRGFNVELYVQDAAEKNAANGVYSVLKDKWIKLPKEMEDLPYNREVVKKKSLDYIERIDYLESMLDKGANANKVGEIAQLIKDKIILSRRWALSDTGNEMNEANLIFKVLRRADYIGKLNDLITRTYDMKRTVNERNDSDPVYLDDMPDGLEDAINNPEDPDASFRATFHENDRIDLPYIYVDIPVKKPNGRSPNFNNERKKEFKNIVKSFGWYVLPDLLRPEDIILEPGEKPYYSALISPYPNPADPGIGKRRDDDIEKDRKNQVSQQDNWERAEQEEEDEDFEEIRRMTSGALYENTKVTLTIGQLKRLIKESSDTYYVVEPVDPECPEAIEWSQSAWAGQGYDRRSEALENLKFFEKKYGIKFKIGKEEYC